MEKGFFVTISNQEKTWKWFNELVTSFDEGVLNGDTPVYIAQDTREVLEMLYFSDTPISKERIDAYWEEISR